MVAEAVAKWDWVQARMLDARDADIKMQIFLNSWPNSGSGTSGWSCRLEDVRRELSFRSSVVMKVLRAMEAWAEVAMVSSQLVAGGAAASSADVSAAWTSLEAIIKDAWQLDGHALLRRFHSAWCKP
jgi:hypothetical protein